MPENTKSEDDEVYVLTESYKKAIRWAEKNRPSRDRLSSVWAWADAWHEGYKAAERHAKRKKGKRK